MTRSLARLVVLSAVLGPLAGCAVPAADGGPNFAVRQEAGVENLGPGWVPLGRSEGASFFLHPRSTLRVGPSAFIMVVAARHQATTLPSGVQIGSLRERYEIDCDARRFRRHDGTLHPDRAASGPILATVGQDQWKDIAPSTIMAAVSSAICSATAPTHPPGAAPPGPAVRPPNGRGRTFST